MSFPSPSTSTDTQQTSNLELKKRRNLFCSTDGDDVPKVPQQEFICGWFAAFTETFITYPLNKVIFRQQLHGIKATSALAQLRVEGWAFLYRGCIPPLIQKTCARSIMFGMFENYQVLLGAKPLGVHTDIKFSATHVVAAFLSGTTEALLCPLERMQALLQSTAYHNQYRNSWHVVRELRVFGYSEYYRGLSPIIVRNGGSNIVFFALRNPIKQRMVPESEECSKLKRSAATFLSGAILGGCLSTLSFPLNVAKTRMQTRVGGEFMSVRTVLVQIFRERDSKLRNLYRGAGLNFARSVLTWGITNLVYDTMMDWLSEKAAGWDV